MTETSRDAKKITESDMREWTIRQDAMRNMFDFLKFVTSLATASILVIAALATRLLEVKPLTGVIALVFFLGSILSAITAYQIGLTDLNRPSEPNSIHTIGGASFVLTSVFFVSGVIFLAFFAALNF